jgi:hypothetical protein
MSDYLSDIMAPRPAALMSLYLIPAGEVPFYKKNVEGAHTYSATHSFAVQIEGANQHLGAPIC